jgi:hypothetical protein
MANELAKRLEQTLKVMKASRRSKVNMNVWADDVKAVEDAIAVLGAAQRDRDYCAAQVGESVKLANQVMILSARTTPALLPHDGKVTP